MVKPTCGRIVFVKNTDIVEPLMKGHAEFKQIMKSVSSWVCVFIGAN